MRVTAALLLERLKTSFWVLPGLVATALVLVLVWLQGIEVSSSASMWSDFLLYDASPQGARLILSSIATAVMTVVGVLFSITIVILQQVSSQYAPRVIQNFIRSTPSQVVLGFYLGTFSYCLLLLRKIHDADAQVRIKIPPVAMSFGIVLAVVCLCLLIYYVHHITSTIQSARIVADITDDTLSSIGNIVKDRKQYRFEGPALREDHPHELLVRSSGRGYLQAIDWQSIGRTLDADAWYLEILREAGDYIQKGEPVLRLLGRTEWTPEHESCLARKIQLGVTRTNAQDPRFGARQLVDIGLRALSPGINDPTTAMEAINGIATVVITIAEAYPMTGLLHFGARRFIRLPRLEADGFTGLCFDQLIQFGEKHLPVLVLIRQNLELAESGAVAEDLLEALRKRRRAVTEKINRLELELSWSKAQAA